MTQFNKKYDAVIAGYLCVDLIPSFRPSTESRGVLEVLQPGKLIEIDNLQITLGGVVANTGLAMKKFSKTVYLNGLIGNDFLGKVVFDTLDTRQLTAGIHTSTVASTAFGIVLAPPGTDRIFLESPGCSAAFGIDHIHFDAIRQSRLFHFGYPPLLKRFYQDEGKQLQNLFSKVQSMQVVTSLDFSLPDQDSESGYVDWRQILKNVLPFTDIFAPSLEEIFFTMMPQRYHEILAEEKVADILDHIPFETIEGIASQLLEWGTKVVLIKCGHKGAYLWTANATQIAGLELPTCWDNRGLWCDTYPIDASRFQNASGAGDTAVAAFLTAILNGETAERSLKYAALAGRNNLYCNDLYQDLEDWDPMQQQLNDTRHLLVDLNKNRINKTT